MTVPLEIIGGAASVCVISIMQTLDPTPRWAKAAIIIAAFVGFACTGLAAYDAIIQERESQRLLERIDAITTERDRIAFLEADQNDLNAGERRPRVLIRAKAFLSFMKFWIVPCGVTSRDREYRTMGFGGSHENLIEGLHYPTSGGRFHFGCNLVDMAVRAGHVRQIVEIREINGRTFAESITYLNGKFLFRTTHPSREEMIYGPR